MCIRDRIDTEDGEYAIWDNQTDDYYVHPEGVTEDFTDEWLANVYLEEVRQSVSALESVQPEAPVAEPAEVVEASASEEDVYKRQDFWLSALLPAGTVFQPPPWLLPADCRDYSRCV